MRGLFLRHNFLGNKMDLPSIPVSPAPKSKQVNVRLTDTQAAALKQHCVRTGLSVSEAILTALAATVLNFRP